MLIGTPGKNVRVSVCGAFRYGEGPFRFAHGPKRVNTDLFIGMLAQLVHRAQQTGRRIVLVLDNGGAFTSNRAKAEIVRLEPWLIVFWLPKYTSERLNRIEGVWGHLEDDYFSRMLTRSRHSFYPAAVSLLSRLRNPGALRRLFGSHLPH